MDARTSRVLDLGMDVVAALADRSDVDAIPGDGKRAWFEIDP